MPAAFSSSFDRSGELSFLCARVAQLVGHDGDRR